MYVCMYVCLSDNNFCKPYHRKLIFAHLVGKVYNITQYVEFHPGGVSELMRGAGIDCSDLFDEVHHWFIFHSFIPIFLHISVLHWGVNRITY